MLNNLFKTASEELRLKCCDRRIASEETSLKKSSSRHVIRSAEHQKHISPEATSPELTKDSVRSVWPRTLQPPSLQYVSPYQDKNNNYIAADVVPLETEWI